MRHFAIFDVTSRFDYLKPSEMIDCLSGLGYGIANSGIVALGGTANDLNNLVDFVVHDHPPTFRLSHTCKRA